MGMCQNKKQLSFCCRGRLNLPDNNLLCVFGRIQSAPTVNNLIVTLEFDTPIPIKECKYYT
jgi:hypothetical protein